MTSGVKQALPQVLMPKAGVEGKAARNRAPQVDFAETLGIGKVARQQKSGEAKAELQEAEARPSWQRLAAKLDTAIQRTQDSGRKLSDAMPEHDLEKEPAVEQSDDDVATGPKDMPEFVVARRAPEAAPAFMPSSQTAAVSAKPVEAKAPEVNAAADDKPEIAATKDAPADDRPAALRSSVESAVAIDRERSDAVAALPKVKSDPVAPAVTAPTAKPSFDVAPPEPEAAADTGKEKHARTESSGETARSAPRVTVLAQQHIPAPMPSTAIVLVDSIAASDLLEPARTVPALDAIHASPAPVSARSLKIQLHPAELGMVTATLRFAGEQLSVELQVENHEAHRRLASDSETIVKSLRDLGYDIDRVTILQPSIASSPAARSDGNPGMPSPQGRGPEQFGSGMANGGGGEKGGRPSGDGGNAGGSGHRNSSPRAEPQGSGLYI